MIIRHARAAFGPLLAVSLMLTAAIGAQAMGGRNSARSGA